VAHAHVCARKPAHRNAGSHVLLFARKAGGNGLARQKIYRCPATFNRTEQSKTLTDDGANYKKIDTRTQYQKVQNFREERPWALLLFTALDIYAKDILCALLS
jgi:hypothetical protein